MKCAGFSIFFLLPILFGCAQLERLITDHPTRRVFSAEVQWVQQGPLHTNLSFRKINRFTPIFFSHPQEGELVIQANALDGIAAYRKDSGRLIWRKTIANGVESTAALAGDVLYFGANDGYFYALSALNGDVKWSFPTRIENLAEPLIVDKLVYFLSGSNSLFALDRETGKQVWLYSRQDTQALSVRGGSRPAYRNGTIYVGFSDGAVVALTAQTGQVKWEKQLNRNKRFRDLDSNPVVDGDFLYIAGFDDHLYSLRAATGEVVWKSQYGGYGSPLVTGERVYYASTAETFEALDRATGQRIWAYGLKEGIATAAQIYKGLIVFGESQGSLKFLDLATGKEIAHFAPGRGIMSPPAVDEKSGRVFFISGEANVYSIRAGWTARPAFSFLR